MPPCDSSVRYFLVKIEPPGQQTFSYSPKLNLSTALRGSAEPFHSSTGVDSQTYGRVPPHIVCGPAPCWIVVPLRGETAQHRAKPCPLIYGSRARAGKAMTIRSVNHAAIDRLATGHLTSPDRPASLSSLDGGRFDARSFYDHGQGGRAEDARLRLVAEPHTGRTLDRRHVRGTAPRFVGLQGQHTLVRNGPHQDH